MIDIEPYILPAKEQMEAQLLRVISVQNDPGFNPTQLSESINFGRERQVMITLDAVAPHFYPPPKEIMAQLRSDIQNRDPRRHDSFELNYVHFGKYHHLVEGQRYVQKPDTLVLLSPNAMHNIYIADNSSIVFNIHIRRSLVENIIIRGLDYNNPFGRFFMDNIYIRNQFHPYLVFACDEELLDIIREIIREYFLGKPSCESMIAVRFMEFFIRHARSNVLKLEQRKQFSSQYSDAANVLQYIRDNYADVSLKRLSQVFQRSPSYISKLMKDANGFGFSEMLRRIRLENACRYLENSDLTIEQIMLLVGYFDMGSFRKAFHESYGISIGQYRKNSRLD